MKTLDINERFDKEFPDPNCSLCSKKGDMRDRIKAFIKQELDVQLEEIKKSFVEEFLEEKYGKGFVLYQAGELWFPYSLEDKEEEENAMDSVLAYWQSIIDRINKK